MQFLVSVSHDKPGPVLLPQLTSGVWLITSKWFVSVDAGAATATVSANLRLGAGSIGFSASAPAFTNSSTDNFLFSQLTLVTDGNPRLEFVMPVGIVSANADVHICAEKIQ